MRNVPKISLKYPQNKVDRAVVFADRLLEHDAAAVPPLRLVRSEKLERAATAIALDADALTDVGTGNGGRGVRRENLKRTEQKERKKGKKAETVNHHEIAKSRNVTRAQEKTTRSAWKRARRSGS